MPQLNGRGILKISEMRLIWVRSQSPHADHIQRALQFIPDQ